MLICERPLHLSIASAGRKVSGAAVLRSAHFLVLCLADALDRCRRADDTDAAHACYQVLHIPFVPLLSVLPFDRGCDLCAASVGEPVSVDGE
jgi:hypothetical protein